MTTIPPQIRLSFLPVYSHILHSNGVLMNIWWRCSLIPQHKHFLHKYKMSCCIKLYFHITAFSQVTPQLSLLSSIPFNSHVISDIASAFIFPQKTCYIICLLLPPASDFQEAQRIAEIYHYTAVFNMDCCRMFSCVHMLITDMWLTKCENSQCICTMPLTKT